MTTRKLEKVGWRSFLDNLSKLLEAKEAGWDFDEPTSGWSLARRPEMNIIITTGYSAPKDEEIPQGSLFLPKPYNARKMIEAVRHFQ